MPKGSLSRALPLVLSVALHAALLGVVALAAVRLPPSKPAPELRHELVEIGIVERAPATPAPVAEPNPVELPLHPPVPKRRAAPSAAALKPTPEPTPAETLAPEGAPAPVTAEAPSGLAVPAPPSSSGGDPSGTGTGPAAASGGAGSSAAGAGSAHAGPGGPSAEDLSELSRRLSAAAEGCYPRAAARLRAEGTARVRFCVGADGHASSVSLVEGSGVTLLDEAATGCVLPRAEPLPPLHDCVVVPVRFRVR